jgi:hypothetical protein
LPQGLRDVSGVMPFLLPVLEERLTGDQVFPKPLPSPLCYSIQGHQIRAVHVFSGGPKKFPKLLLSLCGTHQSHQVRAVKFLVGTRCFSNYCSSLCCSTTCTLLSHQFRAVYFSTRGQGISQFTAVTSLLYKPEASVQGGTFLYLGTRYFSNHCSPLSAVQTKAISSGGTLPAFCITVLPSTPTCDSAVHFLLLCTGSEVHCIAVQCTS